MAAEFGLWELKFPSSRAVDEDEEEEDEITADKEQQISPLVLWSPKITESLKKLSENAVECSTLVLGFDKVATTFLKAHFLCGGNSEVIGVISGKNSHKDFSAVVNSTNTENISFLHCLNKNQDVIVCQCQSHVDEKIAFLWSKKLLDNIKPSKIMILTSAAACEYSTPDPSNLKSDFVKMLHTAAWTKTSGQRDCEFVETPNTVRGVAAAGESGIIDQFKVPCATLKVLSHSQVHNIPAALYVCYTVSLHLEVQSVKAFNILLESKEFSGLKKPPKEETTKVLKSLGIGKTSCDNLYV